MEHPTDKKKQSLSVREIRRSCHRELYRTAKKLKKRISEEQMKKANELYFRKVVLNLAMIVENGSNRKLLSDWWEENVCPEIAELWETDPVELAAAFRRAFGG